MEHDEQFREFIEAICQEVSYQVGDLIMRYPRPLQTIVLAALSRCVDSDVACLTESTRELYDAIRKKIVITTLPTALDPRKIGTEGEEGE